MHSFLHSIFIIIFARPIIYFGFAKHRARALAIGLLSGVKASALAAKSLLK